MSMQQQTKPNRNHDRQEYKRSKRVEPRAIKHRPQFDSVWEQIVSQVKQSENTNKENTRDGHTSADKNGKTV